MEWTDIVKIVDRKVGMGKSSIKLIVFFIFLYLASNSGCSLVESQKTAEKLYESGLNALDEKRADDALVYFEKAVEKDPGYAKAHYQMGRLYMKSKHMDRAEREFSLAIKQDPGFTEAKRSLARLFYRRGAYEKAILLYKELIERKGEDPKSHLILSDSFLNMGDVDEARKVMEQAAATHPGDISIRLALARFYEKIGRNPLAEKTLKKTMQDFPEATAPYVALARFHIREVRLERAEEILTEALRKGFRDTNVHHSLFVIEHQRKNYNVALQHLKSAVEVSPDDPERFMLLADYFLFLKMYPQAREAYVKISGKWPRMRQVKTKIAELLMVEGRYGEALKHIEEMVVKEPDHARARLLRGILWMRKGQTAEARAEILKARELNPESAEGDYFYGLTFLKDQEYGLSLHEILRAVEKRPDSIKTRLALAYIYFKTGELSQALDGLDGILAVHPGNQWARALRAAVHLRLKNYEAAASDYRYLIDKGHSTAEMRFHLAEIYRAQGKLDDALKVFGEILNRDIDSVQALEETAKIYVARGAYGKAIGLCDNYLKKRPEDLQVGLIKAKILLKQEKYVIMENLLDRMIKRYPQSDRPVMLMAKALKKQKKYKQALVYYQKAIDSNPKEIEAYMAMAAIYKHVGRFDKAMDAYETLLQIDVSYGPAANDLAYLYADRNQDLDRALSLAVRAFELMPESPAVSDTLGWVYLKKKALPLAKKYLSEAVRKMPSVALFHYHLGVALHQYRDLSGAGKAFREAIRLGLDGKELASARNMLKQIKTKGVS